MRRFSLSLLCLITVSTTMLFSGCKPLDLENSLERIGIEEKPKVPDRMVCVWVDDIRHKPGKPAMRGFGGRIMFYAKKGEKPIKVNGSVKIYAFDDQDANPTESIPLREFRTPQNVLPLHYSKSNIGHSYSFFLDWDEVGGPQKVLTLIIRFEDASGKVVVSDAARQTLTGVQETVAGMVINKTTKSLAVEDLTKNATQIQQPSPQNAVVPASYEEGLPANQVPQQKRTTMEVDTIDLPPGFTNSMNNFSTGTQQESSQPVRNAAGGWNTSVSYERPTGFANEGGGSSHATTVTTTQIPYLGRLEETDTSTTMDVEASGATGQPSARLLSARYQALRERLRRQAPVPAPSQPVQ